MTIVLTSPNLSLNHLMCSQSGTFSDLANPSGHSPSCNIGPDAEPDSSSRNDHFPNSQPMPDMGMGYMTRMSADDVRFSPDSGTSNSPVYSLEPAVPNTNPSATLPYSHYTNIYQPPLNGSTYTSGGSYFSPSASLFSMPDIKPRMGSYTPSGLASLSRSPALPHPSSSLTTRDLYTSTAPQLRRSTDLLESPSSLSHHSGHRGIVPHSPSPNSSFNSPTSNMDNSLNGQSSPPLGLTEVAYSIQAADGQIVKPEIFARIDKGFFMAEGDWTCYRRNYFSLNCSYTLSPTIPVGTLYLMQHSGGGPAINGFAISIAAVVDGRDGKSIELVQHTPKRDKGPQEKPARITLSPRPPIPHGMYDSLSSRDLYSTPSFSQNPNQPAVEATFERIQFKNATANNGKRRAAQQYYHLLVELFADVGSQHPDRWVKIATRMSAPMVVRGRSPGHYQGERRDSNSSGGPSGSTGPGGSYTPSGSSGRAPGDMGMGSSSMLPGSAYTNHSTYDSRGGHHYRSSIPPLQIPMEPALSSHEEAKSSSSGIDESPCYLYYPGATLQYEGQQESRYTLPSVGEYTTNKIKNEYSAAAGSSSSSSSNHNGGGYVLPSLVGGEGVYGRGGGCGRWESVDQQSSRGFFSSSMMHQEMNIT